NRSRIWPFSQVKTFRNLRALEIPASLTRRFLMDVRAQAEKAEKFRKLHLGPRILILPNAWDVASARILEELGYPAIATTSAGVAFSLGYPDGQRVSRDQMLEAVARIARGVRVPVTADMEAGYGTTVKEMG